MSVHGGQNFEGTVFAVDPITHSLVLSKCSKLKKLCTITNLIFYTITLFKFYFAEGTDGAFTLVSPSQILHIEGELSEFQTPAISEFGIK